MATIYLPCGLIMIALGIWMFSMSFDLPPRTKAKYGPGFVLFVGLITASFGGYGLLAAGKLYRDNTGMLRIGPSGIFYKRWGSKVIPWTQIEDVSSVVIQHQRYVVLQLKDPSLFPRRGIRGVLAKLERGLTGGDLSIAIAPLDRSYYEVMAAIETFRPKP